MCVRFVRTVKVNRRAASIRCATHKDDAQTECPMPSNTVSLSELVVAGVWQAQKKTNGDDADDLIME